MEERGPIHAVTMQRGKGDSGQPSEAKCLGDNVASLIVMRNPLFDPHC